nr:hypothetical protein TSUD_42450 [Ipomoea batatas]
MHIQKLENGDIGNFSRQATREMVHVQIKKHKILQLPEFLGNLTRELILAKPQSHKRLASCNTSRQSPDGGIEPEMLVEERLRSCRDEREESCGGKDERLRKVLGIESEITLSCGEQVMPFQEHGVGVEGFQEERTDDDDLEYGSADFSRESRVSPSGERPSTALK